MMLATHERMKLKIAADIKAERERHQKAIKGLQSEWQFADESARLIVDGIDEAKVLHAEHVIRVSGSFAEAGEDKERARGTAIKLLLDGGSGLMREYVGTKNYERWRGQFIQCSYGMWPSHGSVIFSIELAAPVLKRTQTPPLNEEEINSVIYYLRNLERIQSAKDAAADAAKAV